MKSLKVILTGKIFFILLLIVSFLYGTFNPNFWIINKIEHKVSTKYINEAKNIGLYEPEFIYENNK